MKASSASSTMLVEAAAAAAPPCHRGRVNSMERTTSPMRILAAGRARRTPPWRPRTEARKPALRQQVHDLEGVLLGDVEPLGDVGDLDQPVFRLGAVDQDADGVARGFVEAHAGRVWSLATMAVRYVSSGEFGNRLPLNSANSLRTAAFSLAATLAGSRRRRQHNPATAEAARSRCGACPASRRPSKPLFPMALF